ncbi:MAG: 3-oxoacyl-[acyl-carrier-protein] synthase III C-terminal domain-containing protein [Patescibacteria group bacterium]|nr:3-oxoacyl-[acyl-carrier-protein] synthase III C-terminal domain-containing protein [Patescibacteria group bacterium]
MKAKIISLGTALPKRYITQEEAYHALGYTNRRTWEIFKNSGINQRPVWIAPEQLPKLSMDELYDAYLEGAWKLSLEAAQDCLEGERYDTIGSITFATTTQPRLLCPSMSYRLAGALDLSGDVEHADMIGGGCQGGLPAICRAADHFLRTGRPGLMVSAEICTATYFPAPEHDLENVVANAIFSDGAASALIGWDDDPRHPQIVGLASAFDPHYIDYLGYRWVKTGKGMRLKVVLHKDVPKIAPDMVYLVLDKIFGWTPVTDALQKIDHFIIHPGGVKVLDNIQRAFGIPDEKMAFSREILRRQGNQSSATIGSIGKLVRDVARPGDRGLVISMGAGFKTYAMELLWA